jgi:hypothetical protein
MKICIVSKPFYRLPEALEMAKKENGYGTYKPVIYRTKGLVNNRVLRCYFVARPITEWEIAEARSEGMCWWANHSVIEVDPFDVT